MAKANPAQTIQRQNNEIHQLQQELQRYQGGGAGGPVNPADVPLPPENYRMKEAILRSVPKFEDDGTFLFQDHKCSLGKFITCRQEYIQTDQLKKTIVLESLVGKAVIRIKDNQVIEEGNYKAFLAAVRKVFNPDSEQILI